MKEAKARSKAKAIIRVTHAAVLAIGLDHGSELLVKSVLMSFRTLPARQRRRAYRWTYEALWETRLQTQRAIMLLRPELRRLGVSFVDGRPVPDVELPYDGAA